VTAAGFIGSVVCVVDVAVSGCARARMAVDGDVVVRLDSVIGAPWGVVVLVAPGPVFPVFPVLVALVAAGAASAG